MRTMFQKETAIQKKHARLIQHAKQWEAQFAAESSCRNLRNYNHALAALKQFEQQHHLSEAHTEIGAEP